MAGPIEVEDNVAHFGCGNADLTAEEHSVYSRQLGANRPQNDDGSEIPLPLSFAFCCTQESDCPFDAQEMGQKETEVMNEYWNTLGINWNLATSVKISNDSRCKLEILSGQQPDLESLKSAVRAPGSEQLTILSMPSNKGAGTKGQCIVPQGEPPLKKNEQSFVDGCVIAMDTLPGMENAGAGKRPTQNGGSGGGFGRFFRRQQEQRQRPSITTVHEAGHWLGLEHEPQPGGQGFRAGRRRAAQRGNVMEPWSRPGVNYEFNDRQKRQARQMALARIQKGNSTDGTEYNDGGGIGAKGSPNQSGSPGAPQGSPTQDRTRGGVNTPPGPIGDQGGPRQNGPSRGEWPADPLQPPFSGPEIFRGDGSPGEDGPRRGQKPAEPVQPPFGGPEIFSGDGSPGEDGPRRGQKPAEPIQPLFGGPEIFGGDGPRRGQKPAEPVQPPFGGPKIFGGDGSPSEDGPSRGQKPAEPADPAFDRPRNFEGDGGFSGIPQTVSEGIQEGQGDLGEGAGAPDLNTNKIISSGMKNLGMAS
ncbi:uncharacterized protein HRG_01655 [Hirsutella rhossiliensis]|uniref:Metallopeptidase n=1 Tax=Hirsutella rhossiliensis TaxID=111463 RepID=A0A9P8SML1_9HYPO|nr:uncharacterized protein HRG_01655 [Hirsutella rhossiliensis]KAH0966246.1 hypothetical protein HRG_01655 [Hirsutella rhossiliensis]